VQRCSIKNEQSKLSEAVRDIKSKNRLLITGTPLQVCAPTPLPRLPLVPHAIHALDGSGYMLMVVMPIRRAEQHARAVGAAELPAAGRLQHGGRL
jgi:hypothetical protein